MKILIVDDSASVQKSVAWRLQKMGLEVIGTGNDGKEGLELYERLRPDVTFLDITMPNMDGREALRRIRALDPRAKVVMFSALSTQEVIEECLDLGATAFIDKNEMMTRDYLENRVRVILEDIRQGVL